MKTCIFVLFNIFFLLIYCKDKGLQITEINLLNEKENDQKQSIIESREINTIIDLDRNEIMYVNSPEGLHVRNKPNLDGERLFLLENNHEVITLKKDINNSIVDGIVGNWVYIRSNSNEAQGWVFGGYLSKERNPSANDFKKHILLNNCTLTDAYSVPVINNYLMGLPDDPPNPIEENSINWRFGGIQICLKNNVSLEDDIILTMKNGKYEFSKKLELFPIHNENGISGYYENIDLEIKPWTVTNEENKWQLIVNEGQNELINGTRELSYAVSFIFDTIDNSPFIINSLKYVKLNKKYTYRFLNELADILILYYSHDYKIYKPILYLMPNKNNLEVYTDIEISWNNEIIKGIYHIGKYKLDNLPAEEKTVAVFDFIGVQ
jgi:hypothetical protein